MAKLAALSPFRGEGKIKNVVFYILCVFLF